MIIVGQTLALAQIQTALERSENEIQPWMGEERKRWDDMLAATRLGDLSSFLINAGLLMSVWESTHKRDNINELFRIIVRHSIEEGAD